MGEAAEKLSGKLGIDTTDFKTGISTANRELRVLESGFKASAATLGDWTQSATGLETRIKSLTDQIDIQKLKVAALKEEHARLVEANGENGRAAQDAEIKLNKETEQLGKMESELQDSKTALNEMGVAEKDAGDDAIEAGQKVTTFKDIVGGIGSVVKGAITVIAGMAAAVIAVGAAIGGLVFSTTDAASEINDLSVKTGISTTALQEMSFIGNQLGVSLDTITGAQARMIRTMSSATTQQDEYNKKLSESVDPLKIADLQNKYEKSVTASEKAIQKYGAASQQAKDADIAQMLALQSLTNAQAGAEVQLGDAAAAFQKLGVNVADANGNLRNSQDVYAETIDALGKISNPAERDALAMSIFGKSAQELNPLIKTGSEGMAEMAKQGHELGAVMSEEDVAAFDTFGDTMAGLQDGLKGVLGTLAAAFLPGFQAVFDQAGGYLKDFKAIVDGSGGDIGKIATGMGKLIGTIVSDIAKQAPQLMKTGITILMSIVDSILVNLPAMVTSGVDILLTLVDGLISALPSILEAGLLAIVTLAQGLTQALPTMIPSIVGVIVKLVDILLENLPLLIEAAVQLIVALVEGFVAALPMLNELLGPELQKKLLLAILASIPAILIAGAQILIALAEGLISMIDPKVLEVSSMFLEKMLFQAAMWVIKMKDVGKNLITGIWDGIKNNIEWLKQNFVNKIMEVLQAVKNALGIHSPSTFMADEIGANLPTGISKGFDDKAPEVRRQLMRSMLGLTHDLQMSIPTLRMGAAGGVGGQLATAKAGVSFGDIYVDARGATNPKAVGESVANEVLKKIRSLGGA